MSSWSDRKPVSKDDDTTQKSKVLSWLLRHGVKHKKVGLETVGEEKDAWIKLSDVCQSDYFKNVSLDDILKVIVDSNAQKLRYQLSPCLTYIRAYNSDDRKKMKEDQSMKTPGPPPVEKKSAGGGLRCDAPAFVPSTSPAAAAMPGFPMPMPYPPMMPFFPPYQTPPVQVVDKNHRGPANREVGKIKSFYEDKGYGFIECDRVKEQFKCDVFVHKAKLNGFKVGDEVSMLITKNDKDQPQAKDLQPVTGGPAPAKGEKGEKGEKGKGKGKKGKGKESSENTDESKGKGKGKEGKKGKGKGKKGKSSEEDKEGTAEAAGS